MTRRRLLLSPLLLLVALLTSLGLNTSSATASAGPETRVRAAATVPAISVGQPSSESPASVGCLRPETDQVMSATGVATNTADVLAGAVCSFSGETRVLMADGTTKAISEVEVGDEVLAYDPETGARGPRKVTRLWVHQDTLVDLEIGGVKVATTEDHPFWNETDQRWERADALDPGDFVLGADGRRVRVGLLATDSRLDTAYNLTVDEIHTYFVSVADQDVLVHNTCGDDLVSQVLKSKKGSIRNADLPPGSPSWDDILDLSMAEIEAGAKANLPGYKTIKKLLTDKRFDR